MASASEKMALSFSAYVLGIGLFYPLYFLSTCLYSFLVLPWLGPGMEGALARLHLVGGWFGLGATGLQIASCGAVAGALAAWRWAPGSVFAGLLVTSVAAQLLRGPLMGIVAGRRPAILVSILLFAAVAIGLTVVRQRWILWGYVTGACVFFSLTGRNPQVALWTVAPLIAGALFASVLAARRTPPITATVWKPAAVALLCSVVLFGSAKEAGRRFQVVQQEKERAVRERTMAGVSRPDASRPYPKVFFQRGVNFTAENPTDYRPQHAVAVLDALKKYGVDSIALVPYGFNPDKSSPVVRFRESGGMEAPEDIEAISALAHQRGFRVMLKPQLWVGGGASFPGYIEVTEAGARKQWFESYSRFIEFHARLAARIHADIFCVGTELSKMSGYDAEWRALIGRVRPIYSGPLVYAAVQGPEFENLRFWDALDYIGLNNYYPLPDSLDVSEVLGKVEAVQRRFRKPVIFPEAGFASVENTHREPWADHTGRVSLEVQARAYEAVLRAFYHKPWFQGVYWWKVGTNGEGGARDTSHTPWGKPAMDVVGRWFGRPR